jgi:predicted peptidase
MKNILSLFFLLISFSVFSMKMTVFPKGSTALQFGYIRFVPDNYDSLAKYPAVIFFHGTGESGGGSATDLNKLLNIGLPKEIKNGRQLNAIVICPQHPTGFYAFDRANIDANEVKPVLSYVRSFLSADLDRIYVTGLSAGSTAVFKLIYYYPQLITAAWVVAIRSSYTPPNKACENLPVLLVSNEGDSPGELTGMVSSLNLVKVALKTDIGAGSSHNSWDRAYSNQANYDWLFSQTRGISEYIEGTNDLDAIISNLEYNLSKMKEIRAKGRIYTKK